MKRGWMTWSVALSLVLALPPLAHERAPGTPAEAEAVPIVFTQLPAATPLPDGAPPAGRMRRAPWGEGARVVRLEPDGTTTVLTPDFAGAAEPDVSFDGERILFAGQRAAGDPWNVFEMNADGTGLRQVTRNAGNCRQPIYLATIFTITDTESAWQIGFTSDLAGEWDEAGIAPTTHLYTCRMDGGQLRRISYGPSGDCDPFLMGDGMLVCSSWQRMDLRRGVPGRVSIFTLNVDGVDWSLYCASDAARVRYMPCETRGGEIVFVEGEAGIAGDGAGRLAAVTTRRPFHSYRVLPGQEGWRYHSPSPLPDGALVVARRAADGSGTLGLARLNPATGQGKALFDDPEHHDFHARALAPRPRPDGRSSSVTEKHTTGKLFCLNSRLTDPATDPPLAAGTVRAVRIIEGVPAREGGGAPDALRPRRLLGEVPVAVDGSFQVEIPANVPVQLQTVDADGLALFTCGWTWTKNREWRGCIGCHEDPELVPENRLVDAVLEPAVPLLAPPEERRRVTLSRDVAPILATRCAACHDGKKHPLDLGAPPAALYTALVQPAAKDRGARHLVHPGRARTSPLVWYLFGRNTSRPWDEASRVEVKIDHPMPREGELTAEERATIVRWIDLGAPSGGEQGDQ